MTIHTGGLFAGVPSIAMAMALCLHPPGLLAGLFLIGVIGGLVLAVGKAPANQPQAHKISPDWKHPVLQVRKTPNANGEVAKIIPASHLAGTTFYVETGHTGFYKLIKLRYSTGVEESVNGWIIKIYDGCRTLVPGCLSPTTFCAEPAPLSLPAIADFIKSGRCKSIFFLTGAGVSTGAGIPDFRSPGGMYSSLRPELLTATESQREKMSRDPAQVVSRKMFSQNQFPYMEVRRPFILGTEKQQWKATISHWFMKFLEDEHLLERVFTQNIDGLDYQTGISRDRVTNVHGSIANVSCEGCGHGMDFDAFCDELRGKIKDIYGVDRTAPKESTQIPCPSCCRALVKPNTVLFGSSLPRLFFEQLPDLQRADLLIVAGTSLVVSPANSVVSKVPADCPRLIVNKEPVGQGLGIQYGDGAMRDVWTGEISCDEAFLELIKLLGWQEKLQKVRDALPESNQELLKAHGL